ncbi:3287_t:CDS:2, partial [Gigaspora margarita]
MQSNASNAQKYINHDNDEYSSENNSNISSNKIFEENTMDEEEAEDIIDKLNEFKQKKKPKRPLVYVGNSEDKSSGESSLNNECSQILKSEENAEINKFQNDENIRTTIESIGNLIKNEKPQKVELVQYQSVVGYLRLLQSGKKKRESSKTIALIHRKEEIGQLKDDKDEARVIIALGANKDGYWNAIGIWAFDNLTIHTAMAPDALNVKKMNMYPSGCQPKMRPTKWNVERIRAYARLSFQWMDAYQHGLTGAKAEYAVRQHKSHQKLIQVLRNTNY